MIGQPLPPERRAGDADGQAFGGAAPGGLQRPPHLAPAAPGPALRPRPGGRSARPEAQTAPLGLAAAATPATDRTAQRNPLLAAATDVLTLLGRLRSGRVEAAPAALQSRLMTELAGFAGAAAASGIPEDTRTRAHYLLSATIDDVMRNLPGTDPSMWRGGGMGARIFGDAEAPAGAFRLIETTLAEPDPRPDLLELMLACLCLGLEGPYRHRRGGPADLARTRVVLRDTLRGLAPVPAGPSVRWQPVIPGGPRRLGLPVWAALAIAAAMVLALFLPLATGLARQGAGTEARMTAMHAALPPLRLVHPALPETPAPVVAPPPVPAQADRLRDALAGQPVVVERRNEWLLLRPEVSFVSGRAELAAMPAGLVETLAAALDAEPGPIRVIGHTDALPVAGGSVWRSNARLSDARAQAVADLLAPYLADPDRIAAEGRGALEPIADNATAEGRAINRRVEILIRQGG